MKTARTCRLVVIGLVLSLLLACTSAPPAPTQPRAPAQAPAPTQPPSKASGPDDKLPVKFGWQLAVDFIFEAARAGGGFQEAGLAPEYVQFNAGRDLLPALQSKSIDVGVMSTPVLNVGLAQGLDVRVIYVYGEYSRSEGLVARTNSGVQKMSDLASKRVAYTKGSSAHYSLYKTLPASGLSPDKVSLVDLGPDKAFPALLNGDVDAWWVWQPWPAKAEAEGAGKLVVTERQVGVSMPAVWIARTEWLTQNSETARRLAQVASVTAERLKRDKSLGVKPQAKTMSIPEEMAARIFDLIDIPTGQELLDEKSPLSLTSPAGLAKHLGDVGGFLYEQKIIPQSPEPSKAIDPAPLRAALSGKR